MNPLCDEVQETNPLVEFATTVSTSSSRQQFIGQLGQLPRDFASEERKPVVLNIMLMGAAVFGILGLMAGMYLRVTGLH